MEELRRVKAHIEVINPNERLASSLGGTGYLPPAKPASPQDLFHDASAALHYRYGIGNTVWKVARESVRWRRWAATRRLVIDGRTIPCVVVGSQRYWWFVSVDAQMVVDRLTVR